MALDLGLFGWRDDDHVALGATIFDLAAHGYLTIEGTPATSLRLFRPEGRSDDLPPEERAVLGALFPEGCRYLTLDPSTAEVIEAKRSLENVLVGEVGGPTFAPHRRWALVGYLLSGLAVLALIGPTVTISRWVMGVGLILFVPAGMAMLARGARETRRHFGDLVPARRWAAALCAFFDAPKLLLYLISVATILLFAKLVGLEIFVERSRWTTHVSIGPTALLFLLLVVFSLTLALLEKHAKVALAVQLLMFLSVVSMLVSGWCGQGGPLLVAAALAATGVIAWLIGPAILRAPTAIDDELTTAAEEHRAALVSAAATSTSSGHPFRTAGSIDRSLAYAVALQADLPKRCPPWFHGDWDACGGSAGFVQGFIDAVGSASANAR